MSRKLAIFGSSGHAKDISLVFNQDNRDGVVHFIEPSNEAQTVEELSQDGFNFIIGVGDNRVRKKIADRYTSLSWSNVISRNSQISNDAKLGLGIFIGFGVFVSSNVMICDHAIIHCNSVIGHEAVIESFAQVAPGVCIGGNGVNLKEGSFVGANATILNKAITVGEWSKISLASVVTETVPPEVLYQTIHKKIVIGT